MAGADTSSESHLNYNPSTESMIAATSLDEAFHQQVCRILKSGIVPVMDSDLSCKSTPKELHFTRRCIMEAAAKNPKSASFKLLRDSAYGRVLESRAHL